MKITWYNIDNYKITKSGKLRHKENKRYFILKEHCLKCGDPYIIYPSQLSRGVGDFCSIECRQFDGDKNPNYKGGYFTDDVPLYDNFKHFNKKIRRNSNDLSILEVQCDFCNKWFIPSLRSMSQQSQCCNSNCMKNLIYNNKAYTYDFVKRYFKEEGYTLLSDIYINAHEYLNVRCPIGHEYNIKFYKFMQGRRCPVCNTILCCSKGETELQEWLSQYMDIKTNDRTIIKPLELDIVIPSKKIAIEYNGLYWHSERKGKDRNYHLNKYNLCKDQGYRLIQVWENEWLTKQDIVKSIILNAIGKHTNKIHGRKCIIRTILPKEARPFYDSNHIQGFKGGEHHGLYYRGDLVSLMTINSLNILERFTNKRNTIVHGAFTKLLKSFANIADLVTFADLRYFTGDVYKNNGFIFKYNSQPNFWYFRNSNDVYSRQQYQKYKLSNKLDNYDDSKTAYYNMLNNGFNRIWDCGNMKYVYKGD